MRKRFKTKAEAEAFEDPRRSSGGPNSIGAVFQNGCDLFWKGTDNERMAVSHTKFLIGYFGEKNPVSSINTAAVTDLKFYLRDEVGNSPATINRKLAALSRLIRHAYDHEIILKRPKIEYLEEGPGRSRFLTPEEEQRLFEPMNLHHRAYAAFLLYTGCRVSEALNLRWQDITQDGRVTFVDTKNGDVRTVPLVSRAKASLQYTKGEGWSAPFSRINYDSFHSGWQRAKKLAGLGDDSEVVPHVLRHTCASRLAQSGKVDLYRIRDWLGHHSIRVTERYAHLMPENLKEAAAVLEG